MDAYPTQRDRTYLVAALLLAAWGIIFGFLAAFAADETSNWFALFALTGPAMLLGLRLERQQRVLGDLLVVLPGIAISVLTFWLGVPLFVGLVLVVTSILRARADAPG